MSDKFVILVYDASGHDPCAEENQMTSPILIREMNKELMEAHDVIDKNAVIWQVQRMARTEGMKLGDNYPPAMNGIGWGEWVEVARDKKDPNLRMYVVKVIDGEIAEIDEKWRTGRGGGW